MTTKGLGLVRGKKDRRGKGEGRIFWGLLTTGR